MIKESLLPSFPNACIILFLSVMLQYGEILSIRVFELEFLKSLRNSLIMVGDVDYFGFVRLGELLEN